MTAPAVPALLAALALAHDELRRLRVLAAVQAYAHPNPPVVRIPAPRRPAAEEVRTGGRR